MITISVEASVMIPHDKQAAIRKALQTTFDVDEFEDIQPLTKGLSGAAVFKISVDGVPYVLRAGACEVDLDPKSEIPVK